MFSSDGILGTNFGIMSAGLDGLAQRQQVHAENLANVDTPGYRARAVNFEGELSSAMAQAQAHGAESSMFAAAPGIGSSSANDARNGAAFSVSRTNGPVDRQAEVHAMMNDNIRYRVLTQQVTNRLSELRSVLSEMGRG